MNEFAKFFYQKEKRFSIHKWLHYFDIYERHFSKFKGKNPVIVEIGVANGGSLEMWNDYFGGECIIYGIDIEPTTSRFEEEFSNVKILIGDQGDTTFLNKVIQEIPKIDILIDDGSHINMHVIKTFEALYGNITPGGVYLIEDLHTSYWESYSGGLNRLGTSIEYLKTLIDRLNAKHYREVLPPEYADKTFSNVTNSLHFYDSVAVVEKHVIPMEHALHMQRGPGV